MRRGVLCGAVILVLAISGMAQETPTERDAARSIVKQIEDLSSSLSVSSMVTKLSAPNKGRDEVIARVKQLMQTDLLPMSDWITQHPEIGFQETQAVAKLTSYLQAHDFDVIFHLRSREQAQGSMWTSAS